MLEAFGLSDPGCVRQNNEDTYLIDPGLGLYLLADGMGGAQAGETASQMAVESVANHFRTGGGRSEAALLTAFEDAHREVLAKAASAVEFTGMGTTLVGVLEIGNDELAIASVGDSRVYRFNGADLEPMTEDQTWANEVGRRLGLDNDRLRTHPLRHVLTMAIGIENPLRVNTRTVRMTPGTSILLSSDGLHGVVSKEKIVAALKKLGTLEAKCHLLIEAAHEAGAPDNVTVILLRKT